MKRSANIFLYLWFWINCLGILPINDCSSLSKRLNLTAFPEPHGYEILQKKAVIRGGSLVLQLTQETSSNCTIIPPHGNKILFPVNPSYYNVERFTEFGGHDYLETEGNRRCRFTIKNTTVRSEGIWGIVSFIGGHWVIATSLVSVLPFNEEQQTVQAEIGSSVLLDCTKDSSLKIYFCSVLSNSGELYSTECSLKLDPVKVHHIGKWTCIMSVMGSMNPINRTIQLIESPKEGVFSSVETEREAIILKCGLIMSNFPVSWCRAISPTGKVLLLGEGLISGRYSSVGSNFTGKICGLEIRLPLDVNSEHGQWRIDIGKSVDDFTGCFITIPKSKQMTHQQISNDGLKIIDSAIVKSGSSLRIHCEVPWPATYCYIQRPNGEFLKSDGYVIEDLLRVGVCLLTAKNITQKDAGRWTCGISSNDGSEDVLSYTDVTVVTKHLYSIEHELKPSWGEGAFMLCRSVQEKPLKYCRFTSPSGKGYSFKPNISSDARFSYWGMGLENGECGIRIKEIKTEDVGNWTCAVKFDSWLQEDFETITLQAPTPPKAFTIGISFTAIIICLILIVFGYIIYKRKIARTLLLSEDTRQSDENVSTTTLIGSRQSDYYPLFSRDSSSATTLRSISGRHNDH